MGEVVQFPGTYAAPLTQKRLALAIGYSTRWVQLRHADGLPYEIGSNGQRVYRLRAVLAWLDTYREMTA